MSYVFLALGSNIDPEKNLRNAAGMLCAFWPMILFSPVYRTAPRDMEDQAEFLNAVAQIETEMTPEGIQKEIQKVEKMLGKNIAVPKGPRTIDLDLLLYDNWILPNNQEWLAVNHEPGTRNQELVVPHPRMHERRFVLEPLCALIDPEKRHPVTGKTWKELLEKTRGQQCEQTTMHL